MFLRLCTSNLLSAAMEVLYCTFDGDVELIECGMMNRLSSWRPRLGCLHLDLYTLALMEMYSQEPDRKAEYL